MNNDEEKIIERDSGFTFACPECEYPPQHFTTKRHLDQHMSKSHCKHKEDGMVHCPTCDEKKDDLHNQARDYNLNSQDETWVDGTDAR